MTQDIGCENCSTHLAPSELAVGKLSGRWLCSTCKNADEPIRDFTIRESPPPYETMSAAVFQDSLEQVRRAATLLRAAPYLRHALATIEHLANLSVSQGHALDAEAVSRLCNQALAQAAEEPF